MTTNAFFFTDFIRDFMIETELPSSLEESQQVVVFAHVKNSQNG